LTRANDQDGMACAQGQDGPTRAYEQDGLGQAHCQDSPTQRLRQASMGLKSSKAETIDCRDG